MSDLERARATWSMDNGATLIPIAAWEIVETTYRPRWHGFAMWERVRRSYAKWPREAGEVEIKTYLAGGWIWVPRRAGYHEVVLERYVAAKGES